MDVKMLTRRDINTFSNKSEDRFLYNHKKISIDPTASTSTFIKFIRKGYHKENCLDAFTRETGKAIVGANARA